MHTTPPIISLVPEALEEAVRLDFARYKKALQPIHQEYVRHVSEEDMALSLPTAVCLMLLCGILRPASALDLGSGFSSWVLRHCRREFDLLDMEVLSVDTDPAWLEKSARWVEAQGLGDTGFALWDQAPDRAFDLVLFDVERPPSRNGYLPRTLRRFCSRKTHLLLDDLHMPSYRIFVHETLSGFNYRHVDCRRWTTDRFGRFASLFTEIG